MLNFSGRRVGSAQVSFVCTGWSNNLAIKIAAEPQKYRHSGKINIPKISFAAENPIAI